MPGPPSGNTSETPQWSMNSVEVMHNCSWKGLVTDSDRESAAEEAAKRGAKGIFQSNPNQFHFIYEGDMYYDIRTEGGYKCTALTEITVTPPVATNADGLDDDDNA